MGASGLFAKLRTAIISENNGEFVIGNSELLPTPVIVCDGDMLILRHVFRCLFQNGGASKAIYLNIDKVFDDVDVVELAQDAICQIRASFGLASQSVKYPRKEQM